MSDFVTRIIKDVKKDSTTDAFKYYWLGKNPVTLFCLAMVSYAISTLDDDNKECIVPNQYSNSKDNFKFTIRTVGMICESLFESSIWYESPFILEMYNSLKDKAGYDIVPPVFVPLLEYNKIYNNLIFYAKALLLHKDDAECINRLPELNYGEPTSKLLTYTVIDGILEIRKAVSLIEDHINLSLNEGWYQSVSPKSEFFGTNHKYHSYDMMIKTDSKKWYTTPIICNDECYIDDINKYAAKLGVVEMINITESNRFYPKIKDN